MLFLKVIFFCLIISPAWAQDGKFHLFMKTLKGREIHVYLPGEYDHSGRKYPVLYVQDGQNLFNPQSAYMGQTWNALTTLNSLIRKKQIRPLIVVAIDNTSDRMSEYTHDFDSSVGLGGLASEYLNTLKNDIMPTVEKHLRVEKGRESTGLMGSSLGGLVSLYGSVHSHDQFGLVAALSPSIWWNKRSIIPLMKESETLPFKLYLDSGTEGGERPEDVRALESHLRNHNKAVQLHVVIKQGDNHSEKAWAGRLPGALIHLFGVDRLKR
jgi:predicted alpha/beta superfamily hydrolase